MTEFRTIDQIEDGERIVYTTNDGETHPGTLVNRLRDRDGDLHYARLRLDGFGELITDLTEMITSEGI